MGNYCKGEGDISDKHSFNPIHINFKRTHPIVISPNQNKALNNIGKVIQFVDPRQNIGLKWYFSPEYQLHLYGDVREGKPCGQCLFYLKNRGLDEELPSVICTKIQEKDKLCKETLLLYSDKSFYFGEISSQNFVEPPKAKGKGILVTSDFIYEGQFDKGLPHGYGTFKTKSCELTGQFKEGEPYGKCIQRSNKGLFIGELIASYRKNGKLITPQNQVQFVNEEYPIDPKSGHTMVEL